MTVEQQLMALLSDGDYSCEELEQATGLKHQTVSAALTKMLNDGKVVRTGVMRETESGDDAAVLRQVGRIPDLNPYPGYYSGDFLKPCYSCGSVERWLSVRGVWRCARCHPPATAALVAKRVTVDGRAATEIS